MSIINTNVYYVDHLGAAIIEEENEMNEGFLYIPKGTEGTYDEESGVFETEDGEDSESTETEEENEDFKPF